MAEGQEDEDEAIKPAKGSRMAKRAKVPAEDAQALPQAELPPRKRAQRSK